MARDRAAFSYTKKKPLRIDVDGVTVLAWTGFVPRGSKTFVLPTTGERVASARGPVWLFSIGGSEPSDGGMARPHHTTDDVRRLAEAWLRRG